MRRVKTISSGRYIFYFESRGIGPGSDGWLGDDRSNDDLIFDGGQAAERTRNRLLSSMKREASQRCGNSLCRFKQLLRVDPESMIQQGDDEFSNDLGGALTARVIRTSDSESRIKPHSISLLKPSKARLCVRTIGHDAFESCGSLSV